MSDAALAKLRAIQEQNKVQALAHEKFVSALRLIAPTSMAPAQDAAGSDDHSTGPGRGVERTASKRTVDRLP
jgi:hypothetical protein